MTIKLIAIDIDDTLLTSQQQLLPSTVEAVQEALEQGIKVVLCTGRPLKATQRFLTALGITGDDQYVITYNGAIVETASGIELSKQLLSNADYRELTAFAKANQVPFNVIGTDSGVYTADTDIDCIIALQAVETRGQVLVRTPEQMPNDFVVAKGLFVGDPARLDAVEPKVEAAFGQRLSVVRAAPEFLEVMSQGVNKASGLRALGQHLGIAPSEMMAMGDQRNDLQMFKLVGTAVAMGNAVEAAKAQADHVTASNDEGGVAQAIRRWALN